MTTIEVVRAPGRDLVDAVERLAARSWQFDGHRFLSDHLWLDLHDDEGEPLAAVATGASGDVVGYAQASSAHGGAVVEATVDPRHRGEDLLVGLLSELFAAITADGGGPVTLWLHDADKRETDALAGSLGLTKARELLQMRRDLPVGRAASVPTRSFRPGTDEQAVLDVNNRAFADHTEQGGWTPSTFARRQREPWFDPDGFRIHERDGRIAAFCWTKRHDDGGVVAGEIYVIAVDPAFHGLGLGTELTLAGLEAIAASGATEALLYVDAGNAAATALYAKLGFAVTRRDVALSTTLGPP